MRKLLTVMRKGGWNLGDQILSAASNVMLTIIVANSVGRAEFGAFSVAFVVFGIGIAVTRAVVGQPLQIRYSSAGAAVQRSAIRRAHGAAFLFGVVAGLGCAVVGWMLGGLVGSALLALSVCFPGLLLQDTQRLTFFATDKHWGAVVIDALWTAAQVGVILVLLRVDHTSVPELVLAWGGSATLAAVVGALLLRCGPRVGGTWAWFRETRDLNGYLLAEYVLGLGASQVGVLLVGIIASPTDLGSIRAAQTLLGPLGILGTACFGFTVPEIARRVHLTAQQRLLAGHLVSGVMGVATIAYVVLLLLIPDWLGARIFSDSWAGAAGVLAPLGASSLFSALATGIAGVLYGLGQAKATFRINAMKAPVIVVAVVGGTILGGALGAAIGMAIAEAFVLPLWYRAFRIAARTARPQVTPDEEGAPAAHG